MTNEEIDLRVKALVKPECLIEQPPPPPTGLVYPEYKMAIPNGSYNAPMRIRNRWGIYDINRRLLEFSNLWNPVSVTQTNAPAGSVIEILENGETKYLARQHYKSAFNADYESLYSKSADGVTFTPVFRDRAIQGEDANMIQVKTSGLIYNFVRPSRIRDLGFQTLAPNVSNKNLPSDIYKLIQHNSILSQIKDVYCACPVVVNPDNIFPRFLLFVSLYRKGNQGQDVEQQEPFAEGEQTVDSYLYYFNSAEMSIRILNDGNPIIERTGNQQQRYNWATLEGDTIYINSSVCMKKHVMLYPQTLISNLYTWKLSDAMRFINET